MAGRSDDLRKLEPWPISRRGKPRRARTATALATVAFAVAFAIAATFAWQQHQAVAVSTPAPPARTIGAVDAPLAEATIGSAIHVSGWALDPAGIRGVEIRLDGRAYPARYGIARPDVARLKPGYADSARAGFDFQGDFAPLSPMRHELAIVAIAGSGRETVLARKSLVPPAALAEWQPLYFARHLQASRPFYILPGVSGVTLGGPRGLETEYAAYLSPTLRVGMRVPVLYLRTTRGAAQDWTFDPDWDVERKCGARRIAEDSLSAVIAHAIAQHLPVAFTLNGGIWADASCDVPDWDVNDHLEQAKNNCQWNEHNEVMPDDVLKHLPGSQDAPELGRSLTFNVYAAANRHYKKRNLQAAARIIAAFARAHPELLAGVTLDPDTYLNPFFNQQQWYDYNPGTLKQFRHWLAGDGPYAGKPEPGVPDLSAYRRARPLSLAQVRKLAGKSFRSWNEVDPPRAFPREGAPFWEDAWTHEWEVFRRHLVQLHYDELSRWVREAGIPRDSIFSAQGFMAPHASAFPFAVRVASPSKNYDTGGMSIEGSIPKAGHLGAILYGPSAVNDIRMETPSSLFATFHRMDAGWAAVEFNTADLRDPKSLPTYAAGYRALRDLFNYGARLVSPMAWNGSNGIYAGEPGYVSFTAWRNTPLESAMRDFAVSHAWVPLGARLFTFGTARHVDGDGWTTEPGSNLALGNGHIDVRPSDKRAVLHSPDKLAVKRGETDLLVLGLEPADALASVRVEASVPDGSWVALSRRAEFALLTRTPAGVEVPLHWPSGLAVADQLRLSLDFRDRGTPLRIRHVALYPAARR